MKVTEQTMSMGLPLVQAHACAPIGAPVARHPFPIKDNRYDPLVGVVLLTLGEVLDRHTVDPASTAIVAMSDSGCVAHVGRVIEGVAEMRPRQAFFARGGAGMLATYASLALGSHGPCFTLSGGAQALKFGLTMASGLIRSKQCEHVILIGADYADDQMQATALLYCEELASRVSLLDTGVDAMPSTVMRAWLSSIEENEIGMKL